MHEAFSAIPRDCEEPRPVGRFLDIAWRSELHVVGTRRVPSAAESHGNARLSMERLKKWISPDRFSTTGERCSTTSTAALKRHLSPSPTTSTISWRRSLPADCRPTVRGNSGTPLLPTRPPTLPSSCKHRHLEDWIEAWAKFGSLEPFEAAASGTTAQEPQAREPVTIIELPPDYPTSERIAAAKAWDELQRQRADETYQRGLAECSRCGGSLEPSSRDSWLAPSPNDDSLMTGSGVDGRRARWHSGPWPCAGHQKPDLGLQGVRRRPLSGGDGNPNLLPRSR